MGRKQDLENQIAENMKVITDYNKAKDDLNKRIVEFDNKLIEIEKQKRISIGCLIGSIGAIIASFTLGIFFPSLDLPIVTVVSIVSMGVAAAFYPNKAEYAFLVKENDKQKMNMLL